MRLSLTSRTTITAVTSLLQENHVKCAYECSVPVFGFFTRLLGLVASRESGRTERSLPENFDVGGPHSSDVLTLGPAFRLQQHFAVSALALGRNFAGHDPPQARTRQKGRTSSMPAVRVRSNSERRENPGSRNNSGSLFRNHFTAATRLRRCCKSDGASSNEAYRCH